MKREKERWRTDEDGVEDARGEPGGDFAPDAAVTRGEGDGVGLDV